MSSSHIRRTASAPRARGHAPFVGSILLVVATGGMPARAQQQRVEIVRRSLRSEPADSTERQIKLLRRQLDSLTRVYHGSEEISAVERQLLGQEIARTVAQMGGFFTRMSEESALRMPRAGEVRIRTAPQAAERASAAASEMFRALMQVKEQQAAMPRGWMGLVTEGANETRIEGGEFIVRFFSYPRIVSVDQSSPAQRAGLNPGDSLFAYDGRDLRENDISLTRLLRPDAKVNVRIRRDGKMREIPVTVAAAPSRILQRWSEEARSITAPWAIAGVPDAPAFPLAPTPALAPSGTMRASMHATAGVIPAPAPNFPAPPTQPFSFQNTGVAGAQLTTITEGLGRAIGVASGVLVTSAPVGSPANESGLMDGDVIVKVAGQTVRSVFEVRELVGLAAENRERAVELEILRQKKGQKVMLRW